MSHPNLRAKGIGLEHIGPVPLSEITERVMRGEVIVVPRCMQAIGYFDQLQEASLEGIRQAVGEEKAARVKRNGFEAIHTIIDINELIPITESVYATVNSLAPALLRKLVYEVLLRKRPFYFEAYPNVRFHTPYDLGVKKKQEFSEYSRWRGGGKITVHGPHHDSWYQCPSNGVNVWVAIGSVKIGNGLSLYPQVYGKRLPCTKDGRILPNQYFGPALNFELEPGDALLFHGEHLHSSELNSTEATRHVISFRITLEKPKFLGQSCNKYLHSRFAGRPMEKLTQLLAEVSRRLVRLLKNKLIARFLVLERQGSWSPQSPKARNDVPGFHDTSVNFPKTIQTESTEDKTKLVFDSSKLKVGEIRPLSGKVCVARLKRHSIVAFSRYCPHEGADLAASYLRDGCVVCPWHNLPFDMKSGASSCQSLPQLTVFDCTERDDKVEVDLNRAVRV